MVAAEGIRCLTSDEFCLRVLPTHRRAEAPDWVEHVTLGVDVQESSLWWVVAGIGTDFRGIVLDYGVWPDQGSIDYLSLADIDRTMVKATGIKNPAEALLAGLNQLRSERLAAAYTRDDGSVMRVNQMVVDSGYRSEVVYRFSQEHQAVMPSHGKGVTAKSKPWSQERRKIGERIGFRWRMPPSKGTRAPRYLLIDTNTWKTTLNEFWTLPLNDPGSWSLYRAAPLRHRMIADNLSAEYPVKTYGHGRELYEWTNRPGRDNHLLDATILAAVAGSVLGVAVPGESSRVANRRRVSLSQGGKSSAVPANANQAVSEQEERLATVQNYASQPSGKLSLAELRAMKRKS